MNRKKLAATTMVMAIALSMVGYAYAAWYDIVQITGQVDMGSLTLAFDYVEPPICSEFYWDHTVTPPALVPGEYKDKDVGNCTAWFSDLITDEHTDKQGYKTLNILVENAYPQYVVRTTYKFHNIGTIPINLCRYDITGEKYDSNGTKIYDLLWYDPNEDYIGELWEDVNGNGVVDSGVDLLVINLEITNALPFQVDPCKTNKAEIDMDFKQDAEECHTYKIHVTVWGIQWNKACEELP